MATQTVLAPMTKTRLLAPRAHEQTPVRTPTPKQKVDLHNCDLLISVLECFLTKRIRENEAVEREEARARTRVRYGCGMCEPSIFHALEPPSITPVEYLRRLARFSFCSKSVFVAALLFLERIAAMDDVDLRVNSLSVHRLLLTSVLLATKVIDDVLYDNAHFAKVGGLDVKELNMLELDMLKTLDFRVYIEADEFERFEIRLLEEALSSQDADYAMLGGRLRNLGYDLSGCSKSMPASPVCSMDVSFRG